MAIRRKKKEEALPPLPGYVWSYLGRIPVEVVADLKTREGVDALGIWDGEKRIIKVRAGMPLPTSWQALRHEQVHQIIWDAGLTESLAQTLEEQICDLIATARIAEFLAELA